MRTSQKIDLKQPDSAGRILIGKEFRDKLFSIKVMPNGDILLSPVVVRHEREAWLFDNPDALASVRRGLAESGRGETHDLGSFARFVDEDPE